MKGFVDKVIFPGVAYTYTKSGRGMKPLFTQLKGVTVITTMNTPSLLYRFIFGNAIKKAFLTGTFWKTGYKNRRWINLSMVKAASKEKRQKWLDKLYRRFIQLT